MSSINSINGDSATMMSYDSILSYIGDSGSFQKRMVTLILLIAMPMSIQTLLTVFTLGMPKFRCAVPGLHNDSYAIQSGAHAMLVNESVPYDANTGGFSECYSFALSPETENTSVDGWDWENRTTQSCTSWVYSIDVYESTLVTDLNLVCDRLLFVTHSNMMTMAGIMIGSFFSGMVADMFGRKSTMVFCILLHFVFSVALAFVTSVPALLAVRFILSAVGVSAFMSAFVLCTEMVSPDKRTLAGMAMMVGWVVGMFVLVFVAYFVRNWKTLQLILSCPVVLFGSYWWLVPESPRWLLLKGRYADAHRILMKMAQVNKVALPEKLLTTSSDHGMPDHNDSGDHAPADGSLWLIMKSPVLLVRLLILAFNWVVCTMVYYGLTLNVGAIIEGDIYLNFFILSVMELAGYLMVTCLLDRLGRKVMYSSSVLLGGIACLATIIPLVTEIEAAWVNTVLSNVGKFGITNSFAIVWLFTAEVLPTVVRNSGLGLCSFGGRIGGIVSPYIGNLHYIVGGSIGKALPLIVFGGTAVAAGILSLFLPETNNRKLPETIEEAENMGRYCETLKGKH